MKKFMFINSHERLLDIYKSNGKIIQYQIDKKDYHSLRDDENIIIGYCDSKPIFATIRKVECAPRERYKVGDDIPNEYTMVVELLIDVNIKLLQPVSWKGKDTDYE